MIRLLNITNEYLGPWPDSRCRLLYSGRTMSTCSTWVGWFTEGD